MDGVEILEPVRHSVAAGPLAGGHETAFTVTASAGSQRAGAHPRTRVHGALPPRARVPGTLPPPSARRSQRRLGHQPALDGVRGLAILLVVLSHTNVLPNGYVGVDLFFALSGFLITSLLYEEHTRVGRISLRAFYMRRARRLLPALGLLILLAVAVDAFVYPMTGWSLPKKALLSLLFVNNWIAAAGNASQLGSMNPTWSLAQEEQFYMLWPLVLILLLRLRVQPWMLALLLVTAIAVMFHYAPNDADPHAHTWQVYYSPLGRSAELLAGCLGAIVWRHLPDWVPRRLRVRARRVPRWLALAGEGVLAVAAAVVAWLFWRLLFNTTLYPDQIYMRACILAVPGIVLLISTPHSPLTWLLSRSPLRYLGKVSYGIYLFHLLVRNVIYHYLPRGAVDETALGTFVASIALASASWYLVESPILRARHRLIRSNSNALTAESRPDRPTWRREGHPSGSPA